MRLFQSFNQPKATDLQHKCFNWLIGKLNLNRISLDVDSKVITRWGNQIEGASKGYNPKNHGRNNHHLFIAFEAEWRLVANFWLRTGSAYTTKNALSFIHATLDNLDTTKGGLFRADSGFYDKAIVSALEEKHIFYTISIKITQGLKQSIVDHSRWQLVEPSIEVSELDYQPAIFDSPLRMVVERQNITHKANVHSESLFLFKDDEDLMGWLYGAIITDLSLPAIALWRLYWGRADCEKRIKELKYDLGLDSFVMRNFWAKEATFGMVMLAYSLRSAFRQAVIRQRVHQTLSTLQHKVLVMGAYLRTDKDGDQKPTLNLAVSQKRRPWLEGLWANANEPVECSCRPQPA